jgi:hypothetical protein
MNSALSQRIPLAFDVYWLKFIQHARSKQAQVNQSDDNMQSGLLFFGSAGKKKNHPSS